MKKELQMKEELLHWLLGFEEPALTYRVLAELLDRSEADAEVVAAKNAIAGSKTAQGIFAKMHPDGYWLQKELQGGDPW
jgi:hypothetical protein